MKHESNLTIEQIIANLDVDPIRPQDNSSLKIRMYCEDDEALIFFKSLIPRKYHKLLHFVKIKIGGDELQGLVKDRKIPEFTSNLIVLDGDKLSSSKNILILPGEGLPPDKLIYDYLKKLPEENDFWEGYNKIGGYDKQYCFKDYPNLKIDDKGIRDEYKKWFNCQKEFWGKNCSKVFNQWKKDNSQDVQDFLETFVIKYNYLATKNNLPKI